MSERSTNDSETPLRPRTRQRIYKPPPALAVPNIEEDAAERKRVLNVLAQRRYRQRKREARLAASAGASGSAASLDQQHSHSANATPERVEGVSDFQTRPASTVSGSLSPDLSAAPLPEDQLQQDLLDPKAVQEWLSTDLQGGSMLYPLAGDGQFPAVYLDDTDTAFNLGLSMDTSASLNISGAIEGSSSESDLVESSLSTGSESCSFPDSYLLPMSELTLLRAFLRIATRLNAAQSVWDLTANSPFNLGTGPPAEQLPPTWQPTASQVLVPHHPVLDLLPWPGARDRMISVMSLPDDVRPPAARGPLSLVSFIYDMEDGAEGVRIWGGDPYDEKSWEVGQVVFERWWFVFDRDVIERSNYWRSLRGAPPLRMAEPRVSEIQG
ncbi:hypothetical protein VTK56DRAFT_6937 [Thermocarpiscus australiensis]